MPPRAPRVAALPESLRALSYEQYRGIRFRPERSLWRGEPGQFEVQFFHPGHYFRELVAVRSVQGETLRDVAFAPSLFAYDHAPAPASADGLGFTGLRLHAPINTEAYRDEVIVFQGASYFRSLGRHQVFGLSARGLAIDTGEPVPEEFPRFSEIELIRPGTDDSFIWVLALLESRRATGAYAFRVKPGAHTEVEVNMRVFFREKVAVAGVAPLTSMYLFGEEAPGRFKDFRPEVHDSDGLAMWTGAGEWVFRPLRNPPRTTVCTFRLDSPRGFGLLQRDRDFASYQDLVSHYQDRPSAWVEPFGDWGKGSVRLLEMATELETDDNIAMLWVPDEVPDGGLALSYRLYFGPGVPHPSAPGKVASTRFSRQGDGRAHFAVDFAGDGLEPEAADVSLHLTASGGRPIEQRVEPNRYTGGYRASFVIEAAARDVELRAFLQRGNDVLTETWSYLWQPGQ